MLSCSRSTTLPQAAYHAGTSRLVYNALSKTAQRILAQGCSVVLDAAFMQEAERVELVDLAHEKNVRFVGLFLTADLATRLARIEQRKHDASDATRNVALKQETSLIGAMDWQVIDASGTPDDTLCRSSRWVSDRGPVSRDCQ